MGNYQLSVAIEPSAILLLTDPPHYLDIIQGTVGGFNNMTPSADQLNKILSVPLIPAEFVDEFSFKLTVEHPNLHLPAPKKVELIDQEDLAPTPRLLLYGQPINAQNYVHFMAVSFNYGDCTLPAIASEDFSIVKTGQGFVRIKRALVIERQAVNRLAEKGFITAPSNKTGSQELVLFSDAINSNESASCWREFIQNALPELEQEGWVIDIADSFKLNFQTAQNWNAEIS
jgi:hypothetical protein